MKIPKTVRQNLCVSFEVQSSNSKTTSAFCLQEMSEIDTLGDLRRKAAVNAPDALRGLASRNLFWNSDRDHFLEDGMTIRELFDSGCKNPFVIISGDIMKQQLLLKVGPIYDSKQHEEKYKPVTYDDCSMHHVFAHDNAHTNSNDTNQEKHPHEAVTFISNLWSSASESHSNSSTTTGSVPVQTISRVDPQVSGRVLAIDCALAGEHVVNDFRSPISDYHPRRIVMINLENSSDNDDERQNTEPSSLPKL